MFFTVFRSFQNWFSSDILTPLLVFICHCPSCSRDGSVSDPAHESQPSAAVRNTSVSPQPDVQLSLPSYKVPWVGRKPSEPASAGPRPRSRRKPRHWPPPCRGGWAAQKPPCPPVLYPSDPGQMSQLSCSSCGHHALPWQHVTSKYRLQLCTRYWPWAVPFGYKQEMRRRQG